jgi:membrane fusion protein, multidrug efflux system
MQSLFTFMRQRPVFLASLFVILCALGYYFWPGGGKPPEIPFLVEVETVQKGPLSKTVNLVAHVSSRQEISFVSNMKGVMKAVYVQEGKPVKKGTVLAELDNAELTQEYLHDKAKVALAQSKYDRMRQLQKAGVNSQATLDKAHEELLRAKIEFEQVQERLNKSRFIAPFDGVCGVFKFRPGQTVSEGEVVVSCYDASGFELKFDVPQALLGQVKAGDPIRYKDHESKILSAQATLDPVTHMGIARAEVPASWELGSGQLVTMAIEIASKQGVVSVPRTAVFLKDGNPFVYIIEDGKAGLARLELGLQGKERVEVLDGLKEGDLVILKGQDNIWPTRAVKDVKAEKADKPKE